MSITLTVQGVDYDYPSPGENPDWSESATNWAQAITDAVNSVIASGDILNVISPIANNQASFTSITGFIFSTAVTKGVVVNYTVYRNTATNEIDETGTLHLIYRADTNDWDFSRTTIGDAGVNFNITPAGQVQYTSTNLSGSSYVGKIRFKAQALNL